MTRQLPAIRTSANPARRAAFAAAAVQVRGAAGSMFACEHDGDVVIGSTRLTKFYLRFHIALLILWSFCVGALTTKLLLLLGIHSMAVRYAVSLLVSYLAFFVGVRLWLAYVGADPLWGGRRSSLRNSGSSGAGDLFNWSGGSSGRSGGGSIRGGGGEFSGGGASSSFAGEARASELAIGSPRLSSMPLAGGDRGLVGDSLSSPSDGASSASVGGGGWSRGSSGAGGTSGIGLDLDLGDDGWLVIVLLILVAAVLASVFGVVLYLIWSGPALLADVAFQAMLAGGLIKSMRNWRDASWETRLLRATWIPFAIVLALAVAMAMVGAHLFPDARTLGDMLRELGGRLG